MFCNVRLDSELSRYKHAQSIYRTRVQMCIDFCMNSCTHANADLHCTRLPELSPEPKSNPISLCVIAALGFSLLFVSWTEQPCLWSLIVIIIPKSNPMHPAFLWPQGTRLLKTYLVQYVLVWTWLTSVLPRNTLLWLQWEGCNSLCSEWYFTIFLTVPKVLGKLNGCHQLIRI